MAWWVPLALAVVPLAVGSALGSACSAGGSQLGEGGTAPFTNTGGDIGFDGNVGGSSVQPDSGCAIASDEATEVPVNLLIVFDKSNSMTGDRWFQTTAALQSFFEDPASAGLRVGIRFFPDTECDETCNVGPCAVPKVEPAALTADPRPTDSQEQALFDAFVDVVPSGGTPMSVALDGGLRWAVAHLQQSPMEKAAVVLVTDGDPSVCEVGANYLSNLASEAYLQHGVLTFAIGLEGSNEALMDTIAHSGGSGDGIYIGAGDVQQELLAALNAIRESTVACEYIVPDEVNGAPLNPTLMNVFFTPSGGNQILIGQVSGPEACTPDHGGWYYDDPVNPTRLTFCDSTCNGVRSDPDGSVDIVVGCPTVPA